MAAAMLAAYPAVFAAGGVAAGMPVGTARTQMQALLRMRRGSPLRSRQYLAASVRAATPPRASNWPRLTIWQGARDRTVNPAMRKPWPRSGASCMAGDLCRARSTSGARRPAQRMGPGPPAGRRAVDPGRCRSRLSRRSAYARRRPHRALGRRCRLVRRAVHGGFLGSRAPFRPRLIRGQAGPTLAQERYALTGAPPPSNATHAIVTHLPIVRGGRQPRRCVSRSKPC